MLYHPQITKTADVRGMYKLKITITQFHTIFFKRVVSFECIRVASLDMDCGRIKRLIPPTRTRTL